MIGSVLLAALAMSGDAQYLDVLERMQDAQDIPGISAVVTHGDNIVFSGAVGVADIETQREMTADTPLYSGSLSKVFTAVLVLQLVEQGKLRLSDSVADVAEPPIDSVQDITVQHLLTHTSGLEREGDFGYWFNADFPDNGELQQYLRDTTLRSAPGENQEYSNIGYATLGMYAATAIGEDFGEALRARVLQPLGMSTSGTGKSIAGMSSGYTPVGRVIPNEEQPFAGVGRRVGDRHVREYHHANAMTPAFGIHTSANDLSRLTRFLLGHGNNEVLSADMRQQMRTRQVSNRSFGMRIGKRRGTKVAQHGGWFAAHRSHLLIDETNDVSVVVLTNSDSAVPDEIAHALHDVALESVPR